MPASAVAQFDQLVKDYPTGILGRQKLRALDGVSFRLEPGEVFGLLGPNRAGKTTLVKILLSLCRPTAQIDWWASHRLFGTYYSNVPYLLQSGEEKPMIDSAPGLARHDITANGILQRMMTLCGFGLLFSLTGVVIGWRRRDKRRRGQLFRRQPRIIFRSRDHPKRQPPKRLGRVGQQRRLNRFDCRKPPGR